MKLLSLIALLFSAAASANVIVCPDTSVNGKTLVAQPCPTIQLATTAPANGALVAQASNSNGTGAFWAAYSGIAPTSYVWNGSTFVLKSAAFTVAPVLGTGTASVSWTAVTLDTNGQPLVGLVTYNVYRGSSAATLALRSSTATLGYNDVGLPLGTIYYAVSAVARGVESARSAAVSKTIVPGSPRAPTVTVK